jgi:hypothetical protein
VYIMFRLYRGGITRTSTFSQPWPSFGCSSRISPRDSARVSIISVTAPASRETTEIGSRWVVLAALMAFRATPSTGRGFDVTVTAGERSRNTCAGGLLQHRPTHRRCDTSRCVVCSPCRICWPSARPALGARMLIRSSMPMAAATGCRKDWAYFVNIFRSSPCIFKESGNPQVICKTIDGKER